MDVGGIRHRLSGRSPRCIGRNVFSFQKHSSGNDRARSIMRSAFLSAKEYRDFAAQCLRAYAPSLTLGQTARNEMSTSLSTPDHPHIGRVHLEVPRNTDCPSKLASCEPLTE